jgi:hypothetical protein
MISRAPWVAGGVVAAVALVAAYPAPASAGLLDAINGAFSGTTAPMEATAAKWSSTIFYALVPLEFFYLLYRGMFAHEWGELLGNWVERLVVFGVGAYIVLNQIAISDGVVSLIGTVGSDFAIGGGGGVPLGPDGIVSTGFTTANALTLVGSGNPIADTLAAVPQSFAATALMLSFLIVGVEDLAIRIGTLFVVAIGGISVGLLSTRWSRPFASVFPKALFSMLILTVVVNAVAATGVAMANHFMTLIGKMGGETAGVILGDYAMITASSLAYVFFALAIPAIAGAMGAMSPLPGGAAVAAMGASMVSFAAGRGAAASSSSNSSGKAPVAQLEAATKLS